MFSFEDFIGFLILVCLVSAIFFSIQESKASPWDDGFKGPVAEPVDCKNKKVRCA